jgi:RNA polymerase sigma factor (sigma-70 family)
MNNETSNPAATDPENERVLVGKASEGDMAAYDELVRRYQGRIYSLAYNMTGSKEDAEDMVQDIFVKAYSSLKNFRRTASFYTWIYRIAINRTINFLKKRKQRQALSLNDVDEGVERDPAYVELSARGSPVRDVSLAELQEKLNKAILTLSEKHRTVVVLHDIQGMTHDEIARMIGCSEGTVRSRLFYARQQLQSELAELAP